MINMEFVVLKVGEHTHKLDGKWTIEYAEDLPHECYIPPRKFKNWANQIANARRKENKLKGK